MPINLEQQKIGGVYIIFDKQKIYNPDYFNEFGEISLTNKEEYKMFPKTPRPTIVLDGFFITKKDKEVVKKNK